MFLMICFFFVFLIFFVLFIILYLIHLQYYVKMWWQNRRQSHDKIAAELRTIGLCDATDSELSIRHLELTPREGKVNFYLSPQSRQTLVTKAAAAKARTSGSGAVAATYAQFYGGSSSGGGAGCGGTSVGGAISTDSLAHSDQSDYELKRNNHCDIILDMTNNRSTIKCIDSATNTDPLDYTVYAAGDGKDSELTARRKIATRYHSTALSRVRNESIVSRSKSFQEQGVRPSARNSRFFVKRQQQRHANETNEFNLDTVSHQNIEITVEDTDPFLTAGYRNRNDNIVNSDSNMSWQRLHDGQTCLGAEKNPRRWAKEPFKLATRTLSSTTQHLFELPTYDDVKSWGSGHILGRIFRRMRKISFGWRKSKCKFRRGDCVFHFFFQFFFSSVLFCFWVPFFCFGLPHLGEFMLVGTNTCICQCHSQWAWMQAGTRPKHTSSHYILTHYFIVCSSTCFWFFLCVPVLFDIFSL